MRKLVLNILPFLVVILTLFSVQQWLNVTVSSTFVSWAVDFFILFIVLRFRFRFRHQVRICIPDWDRKLIAVYFCWALFSVVRGVFIAENYWEYKQLVKGIFILSLPALVYVFSMPLITQRILRVWCKYALIIFILILPFLSTGAYHFYLGPLFLLGCFLPVLPKKWRWIIGGLLFIMLFIDLGARSQVLKAVVTFMIAMGVYFRKLISDKLLRLAHWVCYVAPVILLFLGISGSFNIFEDLSSHEGKYVERRVVDGEVVEEDLSADTRTFIYIEVITSALRHHYVLWGRTPARGNDSVVFGEHQAEELHTGKYERYMNEVCHPNVFTWLGLIGLIPWCLIYLRSSYLAVFHSRNIFMKYTGIFIAFHFFYGWIEDINNFNILSISIWMAIAMGLSDKFRSMDDRTFCRWLTACFHIK